MTDKLADQDIQIGLPNLILCVEMALFAILHFFAFPWHPYVLKNQQASDDPQYINGQIAYHGGPLGIKALIEAFNPWDLVKAVGRGFRWLFVGYKNRTNDPSYLNQDGTSFSLKVSGPPAPETSIPGPNVTSYGDTAGLDAAYHPASQYESSEEGQQLLSHAQSNPSSPHPPPLRGAYDEEPISGSYGPPGGRYYGQTYDQEVSSTGDLLPAEPRPISPRPYQPYHPPRSPYEGA